MATPPYRHRAYGLTIHSDIELPELLTGGEDRPDITIRCAPIERAVPNVDMMFSHGPLVHQLDWKAVGKFDIRGHSEILVDANPGVAEKIIRLPLLGAVMALTLHLRGMLVMHSSAVLVGGRGAAFLGDKGAGKSTTAGAMLAKGYRLLTDDVLAFSFEDGVRMRPGFPQMKFTEASAEALDLKNTHRQEVIDVPGIEKRQHRVADYFSYEMADPGRLYVLARGTEPAIEVLNTTEAFQAIMRFSYLIRFGHEALSVQLAPIFMKQCAQLAELGVVRRLIVPDTLERLPEAVALIERDLGA